MEHYIHLVVRNPTGSAECKASHTRAKGQVFDRSLPSECQPPSDMHPHTALDGIQLALLARTCTLPRSMIPIYQAALMLEGQKQRICCRDAESVSVAELSKHKTTFNTKRVMWEQYTSTLGWQKGFACSSVCEHSHSRPHPRKSSTTQSQNI